MNFLGGLSGGLRNALDSISITSTSTDESLGKFPDLVSNAQNLVKNAAGALESSSRFAYSLREFSQTFSSAATDEEVVVLESFASVLEGLKESLSTVLSEFEGNFVSKLVTYSMHCSMDVMFQKSMFDHAKNALANSAPTPALEQRVTRFRQQVTRSQSLLRRETASFVANQSAGFSLNLAACIMDSTLVIDAASPKLRLTTPQIVSQIEKARSGEANVPDFAGILFRKTTVTSANGASPTAGSSSPSSSLAPAAVGSQSDRSLRKSGSSLFASASAPRNPSPNPQPRLQDPFAARKDSDASSRSSEHVISGEVWETIWGVARGGLLLIFGKEASNSAVRRGSIAGFLSGNSVPEPMMITMRGNSSLVVKSTEDDCLFVLKPKKSAHDANVVNPVPSSFELRCETNQEREIWVSLLETSAMLPFGPDRQPSRPAPTPSTPESTPNAVGVRVAEPAAKASGRGAGGPPVPPPKPPKFNGTPPTVSARSAVIPPQKPARPTLHPQPRLQPQPQLQSSSGHSRSASTAFSRFRSNFLSPYSSSSGRSTASIAASPPPPQYSKRSSSVSAAYASPDSPPNHSTSPSPSPSHLAPNSDPTTRSARFSSRSPFLSAMSTIPGNTVCCDCGTDRPGWVVLNWGTAVCIDCSGVHRSLGTHISKVRSLTLDEWAPSSLLWMKCTGNSFANSVWTNGGGVSTPPPGGPSRPWRDQFIREKYVAKKFISNDPSFVRDFDIVSSLMNREMHPVYRWMVAGNRADTPLTDRMSERDVFDLISKSSATVTFSQTIDWLCGMHVAAIVDNFLALLAFSLGSTKVSVCDSLGNTALHWAVNCDNPKSVAMLIAIGGISLSIEAKNAEGRTPIDIVVANDAKSVLVGYIERLQGKTNNEKAIRLAIWNEVFGRNTDEQILSEFDTDY